MLVHAPAPRAPRRTRRHPRGALLVAAVGLVAALGAGTSAGAATRSARQATAETGTLPKAAEKIMEQPIYANARWLYLVADRETGEVLLSNHADELVFTAATGKNFTVGSVYDRIGPNTRLTTPVIATTPIANGAIAGDVVLVASGDLAMGGRGGLDGRFEHTFDAGSVDHVDANLAPNATVVGQPLAGLDDLARQVARKGVRRIDGNVVIDTRLWDDFAGQEGPVPPIFVNDNLVDVQVTGDGAGAGPTIEVRPATSAFTVRSELETVPAGGDTMLDVVEDPADPTVLVVRGTIAAGHTQLTTSRVTDPGAWARTLFIEALGRAGVTVAAPAIAPNDESTLPASETLDDGIELAAIKSPPVKAMGRAILEMSYSAGSNAFLCLLAVDAGETDCNKGLVTMNELAVDAGLDPDALFLVDGQGADPASTTPRQMTKWMRWATTRPWAKPFVNGQPVLGETGSLAANGVDSPAQGKVAATVGTSVAVGPVDGRLYSKVQSLAGYMTLDDGTEAVFALSMSGAIYPSLTQGLVQAGDDVADVAAAFQIALSGD